MFWAEPEIFDLPMTKIVHSNGVTAKWAVASLSSVRGWSNDTALPALFTGLGFLRNSLTNYHEGGEQIRLDILNRERAFMSVHTFVPCSDTSRICQSFSSSQFLAFSIQHLSSFRFESNCSHVSFGAVDVASSVQQHSCRNVVGSFRKRIDEKSQRGLPV